MTEAPQPEQHELLVKVADSAAPLRPTIEPTSDSSVAPAPVAQTAAAMQGVWAPGNACSLRSFREGALPTIINPDGAWAGETFCFFKNQKHLESGWSVIANCSNAREQWTNLVHLTIKGDRLIWASKRGTQTYTRARPTFSWPKPGKLRLFRWSHFLAANRFPSPDRVRGQALPENA